MLQSINTRYQYQSLYILMPGFEECKQSRSFSYDRFIHQIAANHLEFPNENQNFTNYQNYLKNQMLYSEKKCVQRCKSISKSSSVCDLLRSVNASKATDQRQIPEHKPVKSCHIPQMLNCFSLNLIDWGYNNNIAVAIKNRLYMWRSHRKVAKLFKKLDIGSISSVKCNSECLLALGSTRHGITVYDLHKNQEILTKREHLKQINTIDWKYCCMLSGAKDGSIILSDIRCEKNITKYKAHANNVFSAKWNLRGNLLASVGEDEKVVLYDVRKNAQLFVFRTIQGASRALDWCSQNQNILLAGGGKRDKCLRFYNINTMKQEYAIQTQSQIWNVAFSHISNQMVSTHGNKGNDIKIWKTDNLWIQKQYVKNIGVMTGHSQKVAYMAMSPNGEQIATCSGDKTVNIWRPFQASKDGSEQLYAKDLR